ncbi:Maf family protein [Marinomonas balearica]|uniref:7-methyl-GTP pyrophosphatase n=1 Tax=Marinomonas balearica TaxID=491947 RepID=A0A4V3CG96_9GAMM|nr:Maf family protein [Marinomonas balearica]TDO96882.1 MAF protein [Marinomonas balearica]
MKPAIILGSSSPYRKALLERLGIPFTTQSPDIDETPQSHESISDYVLRMSQEKAKTIFNNCKIPNALIITSDQSATLSSTKSNKEATHDQIIGKPHTIENAQKQLESFSSNKVVFYTSVSITCTRTHETKSKVTQYSVHFKKLSSEEISRYISIEKPLDCAGSFKCEGLGVRLFDKMEGEDPTSLEGLPLIAICDLLCHFGADPLTYKTVNSL